MKQFGLVMPAVGVVLLAPAALSAQSLEPVLVIGTRASVESAAERKRRSADIVDGILAEEINRLPDLSVADAVQRITGVQITRDRGEASIATVRGLVQVETTLNGRELFTAGFGRALDYADLPSDMLAGIDVYKSSAASRIEGGLGGTVDLRTRRPFDFRKPTLALSARYLHGDLVDKGAGQFSLLYGGRTAVPAGEAAVLVNLVLQDRAYREDQKGTGAPTPCSARAAPPQVCRLDLVPGEDTVVPSSSSESTSFGRRRRSAASVMLGWQPSPAWDLYAEAHFAELHTRQDTQQVNIGPNFAPGSFDPTSVSLFAGTHDVQRITWTNTPLSILGFARDTVDRTRQVAAGGAWQAGDLRLSGDLSHTRSFNNLFFSGPTLAGTAARFTHDLAATVPSTSVEGTDLAAPANLRYVSLAYRVRPLRGSLLAGRIDAEWQLDRGALERVTLGWRHSRRDADNAPNLIFGDVALPGISATAQPGRTAVYPYAPFLDARAGSIEGYLTDTLADARDSVALRRAFGITAPLPTAGGPLGVWRIRETTDAAYAEAGWKWPALALDGQAGLRLVHTRSTLSGNQSVPSSATIEPLDIDTTTTDWLPSASLRWHAGGPWQLRAAASRTLTRPDFNLLSPSITLTPNSINPQLNQGTAGNPALRPLRATNADLAAEGNFGAGHAAALTLFWKRVDGFTATLSQAETHDGQLYQVNRPYNADAGYIRGAELSYQRFLDFLPGAWRGLGLQANTTFVDSSTYDRVLRANVTLQNLPRRSTNLVGLYEQGAWSARLAWNWRSSFPSGTVSIVGLGALQATTRAYGWLDASLRWRISDELSWSLDGGNLLGTLRRSYFGVATRPQNAWVNDRQIGTSLSLRL